MALKTPSIFNCLKKPIYLQRILLILNKADPAGTGVMLPVIKTLKYRLANSCCPKFLGFPLLNFSFPFPQDHPLFHLPQSSNSLQRGLFRLLGAHATQVVISHLTHESSLPEGSLPFPSPKLTPGETGPERERDLPTVIKTVGDRAGSRMLPAPPS